MLSMTLGSGVLNKSAISGMQGFVWGCYTYGAPGKSSHL